MSLVFDDLIKLLVRLIQKYSSKKESRYETI